MEPFGITIVVLIFLFLGTKLLFYFLRLELDRKQLQVRVNLLELQCGMKTTKFDNTPPSFESFTSTQEMKVSPTPKYKPIAPNTLKFMIKACHPDKHNDNIEAKNATAWLLDQRKK